MVEYFCFTLPYIMQIVEKKFEFECPKLVNLTDHQHFEECVP